ncbi:MAG TPA: CmcJ/NvfI family oxidoreductase, partial [Sphingomicrobium sp.]|nr:CmcJ/NvfI family oxidoreductase [Sphingomicrobium sp.]
GPLTFEAYAANVGAFAGEQAKSWWLERYQRDDVTGFMSIDFWRTTNMAGPLRHMPLAVCAPASLERTDILEMDFIGIAPEGRTTHHLALRFNPDQRWHYYPEMTGDEFLAFKLCQFSKDDAEAPPQNCFHSAFADPRTPPDAEERQSCEHRVGVLLLRD